MQGKLWQNLLNVKIKLVETMKVTNCGICYKNADGFDIQQAGISSIQKSKLRMGED